MSKDKNNQEPDLSKYDDLNSLSLKKMEFGLWLSENRAKIMRIVVIFLIAVSAFFFIYSSYNYVFYFLTGSTKEDVLALTKSNVTSQRKVTQDIIVSSPQIFKSGEAYDLVASVKNPNDKFFANLGYCFVINEKNVFCGSDFIMPGEEKYLLALGQKIDSVSPLLSFKLTSTSWQRVDAHKIPDWDSFSRSRLNFSFESVNLALANESGLSEKIGLDSLEFTVTNRTSYGYYEVPLVIAFYRGSELVGVNRYVVKNFLAGESRPVRLSWLGGLGEVTRTEIKPELNLPDDSIYLKYQGTQ
jgi:hypothetical protein